MKNDGYTPTIGLEIHAELKTKTKMFCGSRNSPHEETPNTHVCPVCVGHPGTLPVVNKEAVRHVLLVGRALGGTLATYTEFDRKNYFYPDIPKGYQISQYAFPLVSGGSLGEVDITRVHLEEDTARSLHDKATGSIIDYNRAGVPLMELVTEPVIHDAETAGLFARELQLLLRALGVSDANMEKGEMRVEVNISLSKDDTLGSKVEVKNINSFKAAEASIAFEIDRQRKVLDGGGEVVQETRGWNEARMETTPQRKKESAHDYRYFPDPDIPKIHIDHMEEFSLSRLDEIMPEKPSDKRLKFANLGLPNDMIEMLVSDFEMADFYNRSLENLKNIVDVDEEDIKRLAHYTSSDVLGHIGQGADLSFSDANSEYFSRLISMIKDGSLTSRVAKDILYEVVFESNDPRVIAEERGLAQQNSEDVLNEVVSDIVKEHKDVVREYKEGKEASLQFLIGQGMKATKGTANPALLKTILVDEISRID